MVTTTITTILESCIETIIDNNQWVLIYSQYSIIIIILHPVMTC